MRVRTQLLLAFLVLAVAPLAGIVLYSYASSLRAFRHAVAAESRALAEEMGEQLDAVKTDLDRRLESLTRLPVRSLMGSGPTERDVADPNERDVADLYVDLMSQMGDLATLVEWLEFTPESQAAGGPQEPFLIYPSQALVQALTRLRKLRDLEDSGLPEGYFESTVREVIQEQSALKEAELEALAAGGEEMRELLGQEFASPVRQGDEVVGYLEAMVPAPAILRQVLARAERERGGLPYARDEEGALYVDEPGDRSVLEEIGVGARREGFDAAAARDWLVVEVPYPDSALTFGIARPIADSLREIRQTAARNFFYGMAMIILAMAGILWLSSRMTRNLTLLTEGAERLAAGDLESRVPLGSKDEFGRLAGTFNRMAHELSEQQRRLLEEERLRKEQEIQQRLLEAEHRRKTRELEEARELQLSLLPKSLPRHAGLGVAVFMRTATEVGGDYYDFFTSGDGRLTAAIGDAAGHGARAGTMVTVVKGLFTAGAGRSDPPEVLAEATRALKEMRLGRMTMGVTLLRFADGGVTVSTAGMPPVLIHRRGEGRIEEVALAGVPLGGLADAAYERWQSRLAVGDTVLLMTDGFPELLDGDGEPLGYRRARSAFADVADAATPEDVISGLAAAADRWRADRPPDDDMTFVVLRVTG